MLRNRLLAVVPLTVTAALLAAAPAQAITYGSPDGSAHPQVGALVADHAYSDGTWTYCTGTLISPTVFLTAAHCGDAGQTTARVSFSSAYKDGDRTYAGRFVPDPDYGGPQSDPHDIAVVVFSKPINGIAPAKLPTAGLLDRLKADGTLQQSSFTSVGYGSYAPSNGPGGKTYFYDDVRQATSGSYNTLENVWLKLSQNPSTGNGGTCYGDSGGPNFLGGASSTLLVATTISGDSACRSTNVDYRLDTPAARSFLGRFVTLP